MQVSHLQDTIILSHGQEKREPGRKIDCHPAAALEGWMKQYIIQISADFWSRSLAAILQIPHSKSNIILIIQLHCLHSIGNRYSLPNMPLAECQQQIAIQSALVHVQSSEQRTNNKMKACTFKPLTGSLPNMHNKYMRFCIQLHMDKPLKLSGGPRLPLPL